MSPSLTQLPVSSPGEGRSRIRHSPRPRKTKIPAGCVLRGWDPVTPPRGVTLPTPPTRVAAAIHSGVSRAPSGPPSARGRSRKPPHPVPEWARARFRRWRPGCRSLGHPGQPAAGGVSSAINGSRSQIVSLGDRINWKGPEVNHWHRNTTLFHPIRFPSALPLGGSRIQPLPLPSSSSYSLPSSSYSLIFFFSFIDIREKGVGGERTSTGRLLHVPSWGSGPHVP